jgi:hypothetical protein
MIRRIRAIYLYVAPESATDGVTLICSPDPGAVPASAESVEEYREVHDIAELGGEYRSGVSVIELPNGRCRISAQTLALADCDPADLVYRFDQFTGEHFLIAGEKVVVESPEFFLTPFSTPTFFELEEALDGYAKDAARLGELHGLRELWRDDARLMFLPAPEKGMRRSMEHYLKATLRATKTVELRPEQNVDETKPADIKVTFSHSNRLAYIEIKWMGDSAPKPLRRGKKPNKLREKAVTDGASQLARYLDLDEVRSTENLVTGYLVVFDARRRRLKPTTRSISASDGLHYRGRDIRFDDKILQRADFAPPRRMFMEPVYQR